MEKDKLSISIIIPIYNAEKTIEKCLKSLLLQQYPTEKFEIVAVNNGSTDRTDEILKKFNIKILNELQKRSPYAARNKGIKAAKGEIIVFIDADCVAESSWLSSLEQNFHDSIVGAVAGRVKAYAPRTITEKYQARKDVFLQENFIKGWVTPLPLAGNAPYRASIFKDIGFLNETLFSGGDVDFAKRLCDSTSYRIVRADNAVVYHHHCSNAHLLWKQRYRYGYGLRQVMDLHPSFKPFMRVSCPYLYAVVGLFYSLSRFFYSILLFCCRKAKSIDFVVPWLDLWSEVAFRKGYNIAVSSARSKIGFSHKVS